MWMCNVSDGREAWTELDVATLTKLFTYCIAYFLVTVLHMYVRSVLYVCMYECISTVVMQSVIEPLCIHYCPYYAYHWSRSNYIILSKVFSFFLCTCSIFSSLFNRDMCVWLSDVVEWASAHTVCKWVVYCMLLVAHSVMYCVLLSQYVLSRTCNQGLRPHCAVVIV